ncbi:hypothetical protein ACFSTC_48615 [Nonomuraea ferruginea]
MAERLLIGQWALLLGYAGLPWVVHALDRGRRLAVSVLPAATGGFAAMLVTVVTALPVAASSGRRWGRVLQVGLVLGAFCLPWLVPSGAAARRSRRGPGGGGGVRLAGRHAVRDGGEPAVPRRDLERERRARRVRRDRRGGGAAGARGRGDRRVLVAGPPVAVPERARGGRRRRVRHRVRGG